MRRDGESCVLCGAIENLLCHHRKPGVNRVRHFATLCRADHNRAHHLAKLHFHLPAKLKELWRELHPEESEQLELPFGAPEPAEQLELMHAA